VKCGQCFVINPELIAAIEQAGHSDRMSSDRGNRRDQCARLQEARK
jgi:hypothetical protein